MLLFNKSQRAFITATGAIMPEQTLEVPAAEGEKLLKMYPYELKDISPKVAENKPDKSAKPEPAKTKIEISETDIIKTEEVAQKDIPADAAIVDEVVVTEPHKETAEEKRLRRAEKKEKKEAKKAL